MTKPNVALGLKGIIALETEIADVDGPGAALYYRGYHIDDLIAHANYEEVAYLLFHGELPDGEELKSFRRQIAAEQTIPEQVIAILRSLPRNGVPMAMLRTVVSALAHFDPDAEDQSEEANVRKAMRLTARVPILVSMIGRFISGHDTFAEPNPELSIAANFLRILNGAEPTAVAVKTLDYSLTLHAEHSLNASTFASRVTTSTLSDMYSAVTTGIGTLKGPLHGGANEGVMRMLTEIQTTERAEPFVREKLNNGEVIMGIGHAVYKNGDPRVKHLKGLSKQLNEQNGTSHWYEISEIVESILLNEKGLHPNVDFYSASAYNALGLDPKLFTPLFAAARTSGWTAHILEQMRDNVLIRPQAAYVGPDVRRIG